MVKELAFALTSIPYLQILGAVVVGNKAIVPRCFGKIAPGYENIICITYCKMIKSAFFRRWPKLVVMWWLEKLLPWRLAIYEQISKRNSNLICHNCPTQLSHKCPPIKPKMPTHWVINAPFIKPKMSYIITFYFILCVCANFSRGEHWCASQCWCSPTRHNYSCFWMLNHLHTVGEFVIYVVETFVL